MKLYLDDVRETPENWVRAYNAREAIEYLKTGKVVEISLDHDRCHPIIISKNMNKT